LRLARGEVLPRGGDLLGQRIERTSLLGLKIQ